MFLLEMSINSHKESNFDKKKQAHDFTWWHQIKKNNQHPVAAAPNERKWGTMNAPDAKRDSRSLVKHPAILGLSSPVGRPCPASDTFCM